MKVELQHLPSSTSALFRKLAGEKYMNRFSLVGGSALAIQLGHRQSEDLDFAFDAGTINSLSIKRFIAKVFPRYRLIREEKDYQLDFIIDNVKLTFFSTGAVLIPFPIKDHVFEYKNLYIADPLIIAVLKLVTISQRSTIRDYYDLYYISKHILSLSEIYRQTKLLVPNLSPIIYSETIIYTMDILEDSLSDHLQPKEKVTKEQISSYFVDELKKMK